MILGIACAIGAGLLWCGVGIVYSLLARKKAVFIAFMARTYIALVALAWIVVPRYREISEQAPHLVALGGLLLLAGFFSSSGMIAVNGAMRRGHHGATWMISQSALVIPFLCGVVLWHDHARMIHVCGVGAAVAGILAIGNARRSDEPTTGAGSSSWLPIAILAFLLLGASQTITTIPSRWHDWHDTARLRVPFLLTGCLAAFLSASVLTRPRREKWLWPYALALAGTVLPSQLLVFRAIDILDKTSRAALVYPIAIGTCIVGFSLYSAVVVRERLSPMRITGFVLGTVGVVLTSLK